PGGEAPALSASIAGAGFAGAISEEAGFAGAISEGAGFAEAARTGFAEAALAGASSIRAGVSKRICGRSGVKVEFFALGRMVSVAQEAVSILKKEGVSAGATNARFASPIDEKAVLKAAERGALIVTLEDNVVKGGFGEGVCAILAGSGFSTPVLTIGWPDVFVPHGGIEELMKHYGLDAKSVAAKALEAYAAL
ncbi:MAG: hypothetical protein FWG03_06550, partial [Clostridiales bacterium]|nr:hypothetical protein [Clostridiales bacterium]